MTEVASASEFEGLDSERQLLESLLSIPLAKAGYLFPQPGGNASLSLEFTQRNLAGNGTRRLMLGCELSAGALELGSLGQDASPALELVGTQAYWPSPSGRRRLVVRAGEGAKPTTCLEIWGRLGVQTTLIVPETLHGSVYTDPWFGGVGAAWSPDETKIVYVAEAPKPASPWTSTANGDKKTPKAAPEEWSLRGPAVEDWGERYTGKRTPCLFVLDLTKTQPSVQQVTPENLPSSFYSLGQPTWTPNGDALVFTVWPHTTDNFPGLPHRLGIVYCYNRPCYLAAVRWDTCHSDSRARPLTAIGAHASAFSPRFSPDGRTLVFLSQSEAVCTGVHAGTSTLCTLRLEPGWLDSVPPSWRAKTVVDIVHRPSWGRKDETYDTFPGLYSALIPAQPWTEDGKTLLLTSAWRSTLAIVRVDIQTGRVNRLSPPPGQELASWSLLAANNEWVVAAKSSLSNPWTIYISQFSSSDLRWTPLELFGEDSSDFLETWNAKQQLLKLKTEVIFPEKESGNRDWESLLLKADSDRDELSPDSNQSRPVLLMPHGGPHASYVTAFNAPLATLASAGYDLLLVNYRGSVGFGEGPLQDLPGRIGDLDVKDCLAALDTVQKHSSGPSAVLGGSHGGFLTAHLLAQAPRGTFFTGVLRNPVLDLALMSQLSDIPDWCYVEAWGLPEGLERARVKPTAADIERFNAVSPVTTVHKVTSPMLFFLGSKDRRVAMRDAQQYIYAMKTVPKDKDAIDVRIPEVKVVDFPEDCHALDGVQTEFEQWFTTLAWLRKHRPARCKDNVEK